jgi:hypothetical protein
MWLNNDCDGRVSVGEVITWKLGDSGISNSRTFALVRVGDKLEEWWIEGCTIVPDPNDNIKPLPTKELLTEEQKERGF